MKRAGDWAMAPARTGACGADYQSVGHRHAEAVPAQRRTLGGGAASDAPPRSVIRCLFFAAVGAVRS